MSHAHCCKSKANLAFTQNLDEMEFERGIWSAASDGDLARVRKFIDRGIHPDVRDAAGYTALHYAALKGHVHVCQVLLNSGADADAVTRAGKATALHRAATNGKKETVKLLKEHGACVTLQDADGRTVLHRAVINGHSSIVSLLLQDHPELESIVDSKNKLPADYYGH